MTIKPATSSYFSLKGNKHQAPSTSVSTPMKQRFLQLVVSDKIKFKKDISRNVKKRKKKVESQHRQSGIGPKFQNEGKTLCEGVGLKCVLQNGVTIYAITVKPGGVNLTWEDKRCPANGRTLRAFLYVSHEMSPSIGGPQHQHFIFLELHHNITGIIFQVW